MVRTPLVVGNWKMEMSHKGALELTRALKKMLKGSGVVCDVVVCPSFPSLAGVAEVVGKSTDLAVGAQNIHWEEKGAWTGEVSVTQVRPFASWCIVGHSERRALVNETDEEVRLKANLLLKHGLTPIVCIGESAEEKRVDQTVNKITIQVESLLNTMTRTLLTKLVIAYEPIWAIGSGQTPEPSEVAEVVLLVRKIAAAKFGKAAEERLRVLYGGSVTADNVKPFVSEPGVNGVLVGGASVHPLQFVEIVKAVQEAAQ